MDVTAFPHYSVITLFSSFTDIFSSTFMLLTNHVTVGIVLQDRPLPSTLY